MGFAVAVLGVLSSISITTFHMTNYHARIIYIFEDFKCFGSWFRQGQFLIEYTDGGKQNHHKAPPFFILPMFLSGHIAVWKSVTQVTKKPIWRNINVMCGIDAQQETAA